MFPFSPDNTITVTFSQLSDKVIDLVPGLASGKYVRIGGVVRESATKQIVTMLREVPGPDLAQALKVLLPMTQVAAAASVVNLSMTAVGLAVVVQRLLVIEKQLKDIAAQVGWVDWKVELGFYANMRAALDMANNAYRMKEGDNRNKALTEAMMSLLTAEQHLAGLLGQDLAQGARLAPMLLNALMLTHSSIARCYAQVEEPEIARKHLADHVAELRPLVKGYREAVIGRSLLLYLHPDLKDTVLLVRIAWLLVQEVEGTTPAEAFEGLREELWKTAGEDPKAWAKRMPAWMTEPEPADETRRKLTRLLERSMEQLSEDAKQRIIGLLDREAEWERAKTRMPGVLEQVEEAHEGLNRLRGFGLELDYLADHGMSFAQWQAIAPPAGDKEPFYAIVPPDSPLHERAEAAKKRLAAEAQ